MAQLNKVTMTSTGSIMSYVQQRHRQITLLLAYSPHWKKNEVQKATEMFTYQN